MSPLTKEKLQKEDDQSVGRSVNSVPGEETKSNNASDSMTSGKGTSNEADSKDGELSESDKIKLAQEETKAVFRLRLLVFLVLMMAAGKFHFLLE